MESAWTDCFGEIEHRTGVKIHRRESKYESILNYIKLH